MGQIQTRALTHIDCDAIVVGGGPAGAVAARVLSLSSKRVVLLDASNVNRQKIGESLVGAARPMLNKIGLLPWFEGQSTQENKGNLSSWGDGKLRETDFIRDPYGCGWHLDRQYFDQNLRNAAEDAGAIWVKQRLSSLTETDNSLSVQAGDLTISAQWLINASGTSQFVACQLGALRQKDSPLFAVHAWFECTSEDTRSVVEAAPSGWWYTAGLPNGQRIVSFFTLVPQAKAMIRDKSLFISALQETKYVAARCSLEKVLRNPIHLVEATGGYLEKAVSSRWIAVGDAAVSFDPLSSQGIYNAIYTGLRGAEAVKAVLTDNDRSLLLQYDERIQSIRDAYRREVSHYYRQEQRWPQNAFWKVHQAERG